MMQNRDPVMTEQLRALELEEARIIQQAMVVREPVKRDGYELAVLFRPASEVGGDFLDYFTLSDGRLGFYVGDVVGKGLAAAMYAALSVGTLRGVNKMGARPPDVLLLLNERLRMRVVPGRFCSVLYGLYDPKTRVFEFANAALPRPLLISAGGWREVGHGGLPSGMFPDPEYDQHEVKLHPGDLLLVATDGLTEAQDRSGAQFTTERVAEACARYAWASAERLLHMVEEEVDRFCMGLPQHDDMTVLVLRAV
jgi:sigma-B regulation protein RsbU (phosphoserine phosphatase)